MQTNAADEALLRGIAQGNANAAEHFFRRHYPRVHALCARVVDPASAEDLAQETFLRVLRFATGFRNQASAATWLYRIARNVCLDHVARERKHALDLPLDSGHGTEDPRLEVLERALARLPEPHKSALVLSRFHDLPYADVARVLDCSEGAARVRVHRALAELKRIVKELEAKDDIRSHS